MRFKLRETTLLLLVGIGVGLFLGRDFGLSWDEHFHKVYAEDTLETYLGQRAPGDTLTDLRYYGPAFSVPWLILRNLLTDLVPGLGSADAGHLVYWLAFLPAPLLIYALGLRHVDRTAALAGALLFASQPLIFGHAFVNPKDTPFMTAFLVAVWAGFLASDELVRGERRPSLHDLLREGGESLRGLMTAWRDADLRVKIPLGILWFALFLTALDLMVVHGGLNRLSRFIQAAYEGRVIGPLQALFDMAAQDAWKTPLAVYLEKARQFYLWARFPFLAGGIALAAWLSCRLLGVRISLGWLHRTRVGWLWALAALALGVCSAIRVFGAFAGLLVTAYGFIRGRKRAWGPIAAYWSLSCLILYAAWPFLWPSPLEHLWEAILRMARFPWQGRVLYGGYIYSAAELPWHYELRSLLLQLTLPALVLGGLGILAALLARARREQGGGGLALLLIWLGLPLAVVVILDAQIYSAFRQLMFVLPALFLLASVGIDKLLGLLRRAWAPVVIGVALAPGFIGIVRLHPYEIVYYNEFVGGVAGASGRFDLETWGTSYREAIGYINGVAPEGAWVFLPTGEHHTMTPFARADLRITRLTEAVMLQPPPGAFAVVVDAGLGGYDQNEVIYIIERAGAPLTTVLKLAPPDG